MSNTVKLREEHAQLMALVGRLSAMIARELPPPPAELAALRSRLGSTLMGHLQAEDWMLYPRLLDSADSAINETARRFSDEMGGLSADFLDYSETWGADAIARDWPGFRHATVAIVGALTRRITRENQELYPLLERLDRAA